MENTLKPCKRCGSTDIRLEYRHGYYALVCQFCLEIQKWVEPKDLKEN